MSEQVSRREFLRVAALGGAGAVLASCAPQVVEKTVEVEKIVEKTVEVEVEVPVQETVVVEATTVAAPEGVVKVIPFLTEESDANSIKVYQDIMAEFADVDPNVAIDLVNTNAPDLILQRVQQAVAVGADLGIFTCNDPNFVATAPQGLLLPLDQVYENVGPDRWYDGAAVGVDGHKHALAYGGGFYNVLWARTDMMDDLGLDDPTTYEETLALLEALTQDTNGDGEIDIYGAGLPTSNIWCTGCCFHGVLWGNCGDYFDEDGESIFDHPNVLQAVQRYAEMAQYAPPAAATWDWGDIVNAFIAKRTATCWYYGRAGWNTYSADPELRALMKPMAFIAGSGDFGHGGFDKLAIYEGVQWPEEALKFVEFLLTGDRVVRFLMTVPGHISPPYSGLDDEVKAYDHPYVEEYGDQINFLFGRAGKGIGASLAMGFVNPDTCEPDYTIEPVPWASALWGGNDSLPAVMIQRISVEGDTPEEAHAWGVEELQRRVDEWKAENA